MSTLLGRLPKVTAGVERHTGYDSEGAPSYASSENIELYEVVEDRLLRIGDGSEEISTRTLYVEASQDPLPNHGARITIGSDTFIVIERKEVKRLISRGGGLHHVRLRCKDE